MTTTLAPDWTAISQADQLAIIEAATGPLKRISGTRGGEYGHCPCPFCGGEDRFWLQYDGNRLVWYCRKCTELGGDVIDFLRKQGKTYPEAIALLNLGSVETVATPAPTNGNGKHKHGTLAATFHYTDALRVQRYDNPKEYIPEHLEGDRWIAGIGDREDWPLYGQFFVETADLDEWILLVEGEKTAEELKPLGFPVTCIQGGAKIAKNNWQPQYTEALQGRKVAILRDQDKDGHAFGQHVKERLAGHAAEVRIIDLPGLQYRESHGEDPEDWRKRGGTTADLNKILAAPPAVTLSLPWLTTDQVKAMPPVDYLISDLVPQQSLTLLYGPSGAGKSFVALDWAASLACAGQCVLYVATEGQAGMGKRIAAWEKHHDQRIPPDKLLQMHQTANLLDDAQFTALANDAAILKPALIVFDTLAHMLAAAGCDENSATDMGGFVTACNQLQRETGCAVVLLHHPTKDGKWERGSGALRGACDMIVEVNNSDSYITMSCSKSKDAAPFKDRHYQIMPVEDTESCVLVDASNVIHQGNAALSEKEKAVLDVLSWETFIDVGCKSATLIQQAHISENTVFRVLRTLMKRGLVSQGKKGEPFILTDAGRQYAQIEQLS